MCTKKPNDVNYKEVSTHYNDPCQPIPLENNLMKLTVYTNLEMKEVQENHAHKKLTWCERGGERIQMKLIPKGLLMMS